MSIFRKKERGKTNGRKNKGKRNALFYKISALLLINFTRKRRLIIFILDGKCIPVHTFEILASRVIKLDIKSLLTFCLKVLKVITSGI